MPRDVDLDSDGDADIGHEPSRVEQAAEVEDQVNGELDDAAEEATGDRAGEDEELDDEEGEYDGPDEYVVEAILAHKFPPDAAEPFYKIKWEGFNSKKDITWEPQANLFPAAKQLLADYHHKIGGAPQPGQTRKRKPTTSLKDSTTPEPKRAKPVSSADSEDEGYTPKGQDWDKNVQEVETITKDDGSGKLYAWIQWTNGKKGKVGLDVAYKKLPQSMLKFYEAHLKFNVAEVAFYVFIYLPYKLHLQHEANHPKTLPRQDRSALFARCNETINDPEDYLRKWFLGAPLAEIKKENVKEFFLWAFFNRGGDPGEDDEELEEYVTATEKLLGKRFENGRGNAVCLRLTIDEVKTLRRSILWYWCVGFVDMLSIVHLWWYGFHLHRTPLSTFFGLFPWRFLALLARSESTAKHLSYWHRPHTSKTRLPIMFIHGIGIGLYPYIDFLAELNEHDDLDDQIGVIAIEIMPVSFRITHSVLDKDTLCSEIHAIIKHHGWSDFVLVSHSYGTAISTHLLKYEPIADRIAAVVLIDPITYLLHLPDVAYNFTYRQPERANEHQLYYFASMDMGVSHALSRCFFWSENILWKDDLGARQVTVSLAEKDLIVNTAAVRQYLASSEGLVPLKDRSKSRSGVEVIWNENIDHAQVFDTMPRRRKVISAIREHCARSRSMYSKT